MQRPSLLCGSLFLFACHLGASPVPSALFGDHAILQQGRPVPIFGSADPGETVEVKFGDGKVDTVADAKGHWQALLPALTATATGADLVFTGKTTVVSKDVIVGDVWLFSGQSNIEYMTMSRSGGFGEERARPAQPTVRQFKVERQMLPEPAAAVKGQWTLCQPDTLGNFTAVGYYFVKSLYPDGKTPAGIVNSSVGGTDIEAWMSSQAIDASESGPAVRQRWQEELISFPERKAKWDADTQAWQKRRDDAKAAGTAFTEREPRMPYGPGNPSEPSVLFNGMIAPLLPVEVRGVVWYQGENNTARPVLYAPLLESLITDWRTLWKKPELPFLVVQLPNFNADNPRGENWAVLRDQQAKAVQAEPHVYMAVTIDLGDPANIHPTNKKPVGERLALLAREEILGENIVASGPVVKSSVLENSAIRIQLESPGSAISLREQTGSDAAFEIAGANRLFKPAVAKLDGTTLVLSSPEVPEPRVARYAWANNPAAVLYNEAGLPAAPFTVRVK